MGSHVYFRRKVRVRAGLFNLHLGMAFFLHGIILINHHLLRLLLLDLEVDCSSKSKITKFNHTSLKIHEYILRLQIPMQYLAFLAITQTKKNLINYSFYSLHTQNEVRLENFFNISLEVLKDERNVFRVLPFEYDLFEIDNVWMFQPSQQHNFSKDPQRFMLVIQKIFYPFDRYFLSSFYVESLIDSRRNTITYLLNNLIILHHKWLLGTFQVSRLLCLLSFPLSKQFFFISHSVLWVHRESK